MAVTVNGSVLTQQALIGASPRTLTWTSVVLVAGDIIQVDVEQNGAAGFPSPAAPTGGTGLSWTQIIDQQNTAAHFSRVTSYWTKIPSDQTSTITQVCTEASNLSTQGTLRRLSGADQVSPVGLTDGFQGQTDPTGTDLQLAGTGSGSLIVMAASDWSAGTAAHTITISNTTGQVTDLDNLESAEFRAISARGAQSGSTNQGTLDYTAATGDWAAVIFEIKAAPAGGGVQSARPGKTWKRRFKHRQQQIAISAATADVSVAAESAGFTVLAQDAAVDLGVNADNAAITLAGQDAVAALGAQTENAPIALVANDAVAAVSVNVDIATIAFAGNDAVTAVAVNAENVPINLVANDATVTTSGGTSASAELASISLTANDAAASVTANAECATISLIANDATAAVTVNADNAAWTLSGQDAIPNVGPTSGVATWTLTGLDALTALTVNAENVLLNLSALDVSTIQPVLAHVAIDASSQAGSIDGRSMGGTVEAATAGGAVEGRSAGGAIDAATMGTGQPG